MVIQRRIKIIKQPYRINCMSENKKNVLFICSQNWHRSKTAETIFSNNQSLNVKSAGTNTYAETPLSNQLLTWADTVFVMEPHHKQSILKRFDSSIIQDKQIIVLDIPDRYHYMDPTLIDMLKRKVTTQI